MPFLSKIQQLNRWTGGLPLKTRTDRLTRSITGPVFQTTVQGPANEWEVIYLPCDHEQYDYEICMIMEDAIWLWNMNDHGGWGRNVDFDFMGEPINLPQEAPEVENFLKIYQKLRDWEVH